MSNIADSIKTAQDKDGMLRRALERIIQLYTDKSHFVYELLQNAEDAGAKSILFVQHPDRLEVFHDGRPFTSANLQGLCDIGKSDKVDNLNQIGEFGVGFKSVFGICDSVKLYSNPEHFRTKNVGDAVPFAVEIHDFTRPEDIPEEPLPGYYTTRFVFPYTVGRTFSGFSDLRSLNETLARKLQNLGITTLLFMKTLEQIEYRIETDGEPISGIYLLEKKEINKHCLLVSAIGTQGKENQDAEELISYLKFSRKLKKYPQRTVDIAFPIKVDGDTYLCIKAPNPYVSVYFPTETESKLDFIVQGPYRTTPNRSSIPADDDDNIYLAKETAALLKDSLVELKESGKLNMSFVKSLPLEIDRFYIFGLFRPLYDTVKELFSTNAIIPSKSGDYVRAKYARIARQERLVTVFSDQLLTQLINDGGSYYWLPTSLTETNREYKHVLEYMTDELDVPVVRPEDTRILFANNPDFLPAQNDDWLVDLYGIFENIPGTFSKTRNEANMATANIVKTSEGKFVAPYRREGKSYIPNVFLPSEIIRTTEINFVDSAVYNRCRHFFDDILELKEPNEYAFLIKDIKRRGEFGLEVSEEQHIDDLRFLLKYVKREEYADEVTHVIKDYVTLRCKDGEMRSPHASRVFFPISSDGINIEGYYRNVSQTVSFVDQDYYSNFNIDMQMLSSLGVLNSILVDESIQNGLFIAGLKGKPPTWLTTGDFRWKLSADAIKDVVKYISAHPTAKDSILKSQAIMRLLINNELSLCGYVHISSTVVPDLEDEPCELIHILRRERTLDWDGKWLYTESGELVRPSSISKHDLSVAIYGKLNPDSCIFPLLGFKKTEADEVDDLKKTVSAEKLNAFFEDELKRRYGISVADLNERYGDSAHDDIDYLEEEQLPFPSQRIRSWDALKKHAAEMLVYADPVRYEERIRSIRVSNHRNETRAYLANMYRHEGNNRFKFACQMCHEPCGSYDATELFLNPETELDPVNLCLCPNCAEEYRKFRQNEDIMAGVRNVFLEMKESDIENAEHVVIPLNDDKELWFTQIHFAEIRELMRLAKESKEAKKATYSQTAVENEEEKSGMSVYKGYIGKTIRRKDGFVGTVTDVSNGFLIVHVTGGKDSGKDTKIDLSFILQKRNVYSITD